MNPLLSFWVEALKTIASLSLSCWALRKQN